MLYKKYKNVGYICCNSRKYESFMEKCLNHIRKIFAKVVIEKTKNGIIILLPSYKGTSKLYKNKVLEHRIIKQINKHIRNNNISYIVCEDKLKVMAETIQNINILNGKYLMKNIIFEILNKIFKIQNENINLQNIYIFVNEYNQNNISIIQRLLLKCKTVNIITENLRYYKRLEEKLYKQGILITVSNNRRKSAKNARIIVNLDFTKQALEKYCINMNSILINLTNEKNFFKNTFRGVQINDFEISMSKDFECFNKEFYGQIGSKLILESYVINQEYKYVEDYYNKYQPEISELIGIRGAITSTEILRNIKQ